MKKKKKMDLVFVHIFIIFPQWESQRTHQKQKIEAVGGSKTQFRFQISDKRERENPGK